MSMCEAIRLWLIGCVEHYGDGDSAVTECVGLTDIFVAFCVAAGA